MLQSGLGLVCVGSHIPEGSAPATTQMKDDQNILEHLSVAYFLFIILFFSSFLSPVLVSSDNIFDFYS